MITASIVFFLYAGCLRIFIYFLSEKIFCQLILTLQNDQHLRRYVIGYLYLVSSTMLQILLKC